MIASLCLACDEVYAIKEDNEPGVEFSHGYCPDCAPAVMADVERQIAEMDAAESTHVLP